MELTAVTAKRLYDDSPEWFREQLIEEFGKENFEKKGFEKIKTFDDACRVFGTTEEAFNKRFEKSGLDADTIAYEKLKIIIKAINTDENGKQWVPNWNNENERKWWPYFNLSSGFGFCDSACDYDHTVTDVGSRLCFESQEKSTYAGNQFLNVYKEFLT